MKNMKAKSLSNGPVLTPSLSTVAQEPFFHKKDVICTNRTSPKDSEPKRIELDRGLEGEHQDLSQERIMGDDYQNPITEDVDEFGKIDVKSLSYIQSQIHSDSDAAESVADLDLEDGQWRKMLASPCIYGCEKKTVILLENLNGNTDERSKCTTNSSWPLKTRELDVKIVTRAESFRETWCCVFVQQWTNVLSEKQKQRTGKPVRE